MVDNPDYKGPWEHPKIANPEYVADPKLYQFCGGDNKCTHVGFELWQVTAGTSFDDIIVTDSIAEAQAFAEETFFKKQDKEKKLYDDVQEKEREEAQRKADEEAMKAKAKADEEEDLSHDEF
jgi:calreticulin